MLLATAEDAGRAVDMFSGYMWQTRVLEVRLDRMVGEGGAVGGFEQGMGQQQLGGQQQYGGMGQMVQQMLSPSMGMPQLGLHAYAKHNLGLGSLSGPGSPSVGGSSTPASMSASMSGSGSASASGSRPSVPTSVSASLTGGSGSGMVDDDGARRSPMPLSFAYQLLGQGQGQTQDMTQSRNLFVGNVSLLLSSFSFIRVLHSFVRVLHPISVHIFCPTYFLHTLVLVLALVRVLTSPTAPFSHPMARPQRPLQAGGHHPPRGRRSRAG